MPVVSVSFTANQNLRSLLVTMKPSVYDIELLLFFLILTMKIPDVDGSSGEF